LPQFYGSNPDSYGHTCAAQPDPHINSALFTQEGRQLDLLDGGLFSAWTDTRLWRKHKGEAAHHCLAAHAGLTLPSMQAPVSRHLDLYRYWLWKRGVRIMPARGDINPADIAPLLPYLMIVERAGDLFRYRQVGSGIAEAVGHDATGITVGTYIAAPETAAEVRAIFERVFTAAGPVFVTGEFIHKAVAKINMSLLTAPLSEDGVVVDMAISTFAAHFSAAFAPEPGWLKGLPVKVDVVTDIRDAAQLEALCREWEQR
jgi:hypothetical protein